MVPKVFKSYRVDLNIYLHFERQWQIHLKTQAVRQWDGVSFDHAEEGTTIFAKFWELFARHGVTCKKEQIVQSDFMEKLLLDRF